MLGFGVWFGVVNSVVFLSFVLYVFAWCVLVDVGVKWFLDLVG